LYFLQTSLFSFEQILELKPKNRLREIFSTLDLSSIIKHLALIPIMGRKAIRSRHCSEA